MESLNIWSRMLTIFGGGGVVCWILIHLVAASDLMIARLIGAQWVFAMFLELIVWSWVPFGVGAALWVLHDYLDYEEEEEEN